MKQNRPVSGGSTRSGGSRGFKDNDKLLDHLRSMQQMEKDTQETLGKFMSVLSTHQATDYAGLLEEKIGELRQADAEADELRGEIMKYQDRVKELTSAQQAALSEKGKIIEEKIRAGKAATQADTIIKNLQSQMRAMEQKHAEDLQTKQNVMKRLEEENIHSKSLSEEAQAKVESFTLEAAELHSAMASLHAEIAAQQRELDESKEREARHVRQRKEINIRLDEKETELTRARSERRNQESRISELEKRCSDQEIGTSQIKEEGRSEVDKLTRERENVQGSLAKMSLKLKQQTETSKELNALVQRMRLDLSQSQETATNEHARAEAFQRDTESLQIMVKSLESSKVEAAALLGKLEKDKAELAQELGQVTDRHTALLSEQRKNTALIEKLERQRTELTVDLSCRAKDGEGMKKSIESSKIEAEELRARHENERIAKERALEKLGGLEADLERAKADLREQMENAESQARQLRESERMREQAMETSRVQQRENANRIIEFSQKNAKLASEQSAKNDEIFSLKRARDDAQAAQQEAQKERDDLKSQYAATRVRLQTSEDEHEEAVARYESSKAEVEELRHELKSEIISRERSIAALNEKHEEAVNMMAARLDSEQEDKAAIAEAARKGAEDKLSRTLSKEKDRHKQEVAELQGQRSQDSEVQRARLATLAKAMEDLQVELREETNKNAVITQELSVLKELAEVGSAEMQERVQYVERDRARERSRLEGQLQDLKEQLRQHSEQKQQRDQLMATIEQQLSRERENKFSALQRLRAAEDEVGSLTQQVDTLQEEVQSGRKDVRGSERKLTMALQAKDAELARLTRRNEVLGEAVTRLTNSTQGPTEAASNAAVAKYLGMSSSSASASPSRDEEEEEDGCVSPPRPHAMVTRAMTAPHQQEGRGDGKEEAHGSSSSSGMDMSPPMIARLGSSSSSSSSSANQGEEEEVTRASTAPLPGSSSSSSGSADGASAPPLEVKVGGLFATSDLTHDMEGLFSSSSVLSVGAAAGIGGGGGLDATSSILAGEAFAGADDDDEGEGEDESTGSKVDSLYTPRSPSDRTDASKQTNSADSAKSDGSNSSFTEKLRSEVDSTKRQELPFSPKKAKRVPVIDRNVVPVPVAVAAAKSNTQPNKENVSANAHSGNGGVSSNPKVKTQERLSRAKAFMQERKKNAAVK